jgi:protein-disulfide isomerase
MNPRLVVVMVVAAALGFGAFGYFYGARSDGAGEAETIALIEKYMDARPAASVGAADTSSSPAAATSSGGEQVAANRDLIREHLLANPEIIRDAIAELQRKEQEAEVAAQASIIDGEKDLIFASSRQVVIGNPDGDVTLVEFFDYNCGYCKRANADMKRLLAEDQNLRVVLKEFPVLGDGSVEAAHVGVAVNMTTPDKYLEFHDALLSERGSVDGDRALAVAAEMGLDAAKLRETMASPEVQSTIAEVYEIAQKLSLTGTPSYVTANEVVVGAVGYDALKAKIEEVRACATADC